MSVRLWVTGIGMITSVGRGGDRTFDALVRGERGLRPIDLFDTTGQRARVGGQIPLSEFVARSSLVRPEAWSRSSLMAVHAASEALDHARIDPREKRIGLVVGGTTGGMFETEARLAELHADPNAQEALVEMLSHPLTSTGDLLHDLLGPFTRVRTLASACASGGSALVAAALWLLSGQVDAVLAGGTDGLCRLTWSGFNALAAMDPNPCRPFDRNRRGLNLGEGAGFLLIERASSARTRHVEPIAELAGWALGAEAHHITNPEPSGVSAGGVIARALERARLSPSQIDYVNAHGTGTPLNDPMETAALAFALGEDVRRIPVSSSKGQLGHTLGAAGAIEAGISALTIAKQMLVPTAGLEEPDEACSLVHIPNQGRKARVRAVISNSFGFGGMDASVILTEPEFAPPHEEKPRRVVVTSACSFTPPNQDGKSFWGTTEGATLFDSLPNERLVEGLSDPSYELDIQRARRLDRPARLGAVIASRALKEAGIEIRPNPRLGVILGSAFGSLDASAAFMHRVFEKGARFASPAEFPNLVPSSPVGHVTIYLGVTGPSFATADLATSGEGACAQAIELIAGGEADVVAAGAVEEQSQLVERHLAALFARFPGEEKGPRSEGAAAVVFEEEETARARGGKIVGRVEDVVTWRGEDVQSLLSITAPKGRGVVVTSRSDRGLTAILSESAWKDAPLKTLAHVAGEHEGVGGIAIAASVGLLASEAADDVLVIGLAKGRGYALRLVRA